ncbi:hypothetical protein Y032_0420g1152 [Ancylostoma ceylanicum]|uniref:Serine/threonine specific protein phosphatases domain-containing protein n=1 Tax=Ancylostoma ceylanicum TaxID=53326 RepID=A0A016X368_9BILA|nr:hypothetical protein Y032_0420g1152 [Ancylostoma ceylanicum]
MVRLLWWLTLLIHGELTTPSESQGDSNNNIYHSSITQTQSATEMISVTDSSATNTPAACEHNDCRSQSTDCMQGLDKEIRGCEGVCVKRMTYNRDDSHRKTVESFHCQNYSKYPESAVNMCTDVNVRYPNVKMYKSKSRTYIKYCCRSPRCNNVGFARTFTPLLPKPFKQKENVDQIYFDYFIIYTEMLIVTFVALWPLVIMVKEGKKEQTLYAALNQPMEDAILDAINTPTMRTNVVTKPVTGQLKFKELCRDLTNMELRIRKECTDMKPDARPSYKQFEFVAGGNGHDMVKSDRIIMVSYESYVLTQLIEHGPYLYEWTPFELVSLLSQAADIFEGESTMLTLRAPITVIGDIRGQYQDLHRWLSIAGFPPRQKVLFLGGIIDREEPGSIDCLAFIAAMKVRFPHDVFLIRGMGETLPIKFQPRFRKRNDSAIQSAATRLCNSLPILARISNQILAVHSGLSHEVRN